MSIRADAVTMIVTGSGILIITAALALSPEFLGELVGRERMSAQVMFILRTTLLLAGFIIASTRIPYAARHRQVLIFLLPFVAVAVLAVYKMRFGIEDRIYVHTVREDGFVEYLTFVAMVLAFVGAIGSVAMAVRLGARVEAVFFVCVAAFTLLVALEEISYGQRVFSFETPQALRSANSQGEFNIHNISDLSDYTYWLAPMLVLSYGLFGWILAVAVKTMAVEGSRLYRLADLLFPPWYAASYFLPLAIYREFEMSGYPVDTCCGDGQFLIWQDQEPAELFFALGFVVFLGATLQKIKSASSGNTERLLAPSSPISMPEQKT